MGRLKTTSEFIDDAIDVHGNMYDYSNVEYTGSHNKINIICSEHGEFIQTPTKHLCGRGCPECGKIKCANSRKLSTEEFINRAQKIHKQKYNYDNVKYHDAKTKVLIKCKEHGNFMQTPDCHLSGKGCMECGHEKISELKRWSKQRTFIKSSFGTNLALTT